MNESKKVHIAMSLRALRRSHATASERAMVRANKEATIMEPRFVCITIMM